MTNTVTISEIVKPMERGQITIPVNIRKKLNITPKTWLWVKLIRDEILIKPVDVKNPESSLAKYLQKKASDTQVYWTKEDSLALEKVRKKSQERLRRFI